MEKHRKKLNLNLFAKGEMDIPFLILVLTIQTIGLVMLFSASYTYASYYESGSTYFFVRQLLFAAVGIAAMIVISKLDYHILGIIGAFGFAVSVGLLILVLLLPAVVEGHHRWILIPGVGITVQPSEVAKMMLIMFCAYGMGKSEKQINSKEIAQFPLKLTNGRIKIPQSLWCLCVYGGAIALTVALVAFERHLSGTIIIAAIGAIMLYLGGFNKWWFIIFGAIGALLVVAVVIKPDLLPSDYMSERIIAWKDETYDPMNARWQVNQSLYAIGSGGLLGTGLGNSMQKHLYVSEPQNDFIFAIVCEELGFVGAAIILVLFALLVWRGIVIGVNAKDRYGALLAMGMSLQVGLQVALNVAVVTDSVPNTGISLPFFSAGGTSLCILLAEMGVVLGVSRFSKMSKLGKSTGKAKASSKSDTVESISRRKERV